MITLTFEARSPEEAKKIIDRVNGDLPITDDMIKDYLINKGWWKAETLNSEPKITAANYAKSVEVDLKERPNVNPGTSAIGKIGGDTKASLLLDLKNGKDINVKYREHLKLLWSRGEVKFDGTQYYL